MLNKDHYYRFNFYQYCIKFENYHFINLYYHYKEYYCSNFLKDFDYYNNFDYYFNKNFDYYSNFDYYFNKNFDYYSNFDYYFNKNFDYYST
jgi:hypothetical protein